MKSIVMFVFSFIAFAAASQAHAESVRVYKVSASTEAKFVETEFRVVPTEGRAHVVFDIIYPSRGAEDGTSIERGKEAPVRGLSYDESRHEIVFATQKGDRTVCANVQDRGRKLIIVPTGVCKFVTREESAKRDNGIRLVTENFISLYFSTN